MLLLCFDPFPAFLRVTGLLVISAVLLVAYWLVLTFVPVAGLGAGSFEKEANLAWWIDLRS